LKLGKFHQPVITDSPQISTIKFTTSTQHVSFTEEE